MLRTGITSNLTRRFDAWISSPVYWMDLYARITFTRVKFFLGVGLARLARGGPVAPPVRHSGLNFNRNDIIGRKKARFETGA